MFEPNIKHKPGNPRFVWRAKWSSYIMIELNCDTQLDQQIFEATIRKISWHFLLRDCKTGLGTFFVVKTRLTHTPASIYILYRQSPPNICEYLQLQSNSKQNHIFNFPNKPSDNKMLHVQLQQANRVYFKSDCSNNDNVYSRTTNKL